MNKQIIFMSLILSIFFINFISAEKLVSDAGVSYDEKLLNYFNNQSLVEEVISKEELGSDYSALEIVNNITWIRVIVLLENALEEEVLFTNFSEEEIKNIDRSSISEKISAKITKKGFDKLISDGRFDLVKLPLKGYFIKNNVFKLNSQHIYILLTLSILVIILIIFKLKKQ